MVAYKVAMEKLRTTEKIFNRRNTFHSWLKRLDFQKDNYPKEKWSSTSGGVGGESGVSLLRGVPWYNNQVFQGDTSLSFFLFGAIFSRKSSWRRIIGRYALAQRLLTPWRFPPLFLENLVSLIIWFMTQNTHLTIELDEFWSNTSALVEQISCPWTTKNNSISVSKYVSQFIENPSSLLILKLLGGPKKTEWKN